MSKSGRVKKGCAKKHVLTWFHIEPNDPRLAKIASLQSELDVIHTSTSITRSKLVKAGVAEFKVKVIPLGVDATAFRPFGELERRRLRAELGLPEKAFVIGSFQKDGEGWGEGLTPKLIKGPDIFVESVSLLKQSGVDVYVLLSGPARGYVKRALSAANIPYTHRYFDDQPELVDFYNALDAYCISSREEGGPKSFGESLACGVPLVSTPVGMVHDLGQHRVNCLITKEFDAKEIAMLLSELVNDPQLSHCLAKNGRDCIVNYTWAKVAEKYEDVLYR